MSSKGDLSQSFVSDTSKPTEAKVKFYLSPQRQDIKTKMSLKEASNLEFQSMEKVVLGPAAYLKPDCSSRSINQAISVINHEQGSTG